MQVLQGFRFGVEGLGFGILKFWYEGLSRAGS